MKKIYLLLILIGVFVLSFSTGVQAQSSINEPKQDLQEEVQVFPNPVSGDKLNITSKSGKSKTCRVFNVLGKTVLFKVITSTELDISSLPPGVYVLRIKIGDEAFMKKLIRK
ncbi:T9SS type A sorting domain-containing protein [Aquimarina sp. 2201CG14-23]|uniref:T9SS type A sorting domain-containing protein n=1 Tax=Aquimarina mycalae TaxID=3040073 RepID=UPI002478094B|nr:T9SS type A sorting domain-containing protein [Aquimarina sp. 2201CG14-23]MDH7446009.1 T9SS type A sorting domain-containing protein [Aquimarina sp. 2201CG14-23]